MPVRQASSIGLGRLRGCLVSVGSAQAAVAGLRDGMPPANHAAEGSSATAAIVQEVLAQLAAKGQLANLDKLGPRGRPTGGADQRGGDWTCPRKPCGYINFARRHACHACGLSRRATANGQPRGQQQPPRPSGATAKPGKNGTSGGGGGVTANRTYSSVVRQPVQLQEFIRRPGERAAECMPSGSNSSPSARQTWADISEEDPTTVVGNGGQAAADKPKPHEDADAADAEANETEDSLEHLRSKLAKRKEVLELMDSVGYKKGEAAYDSACQEIETLTAQIAERDPKREKPYAVALLHAQKALDRATNARAKLDTALDEIIKDYEAKLEQHVDKVAAADERVALHSKKVADLKESIGPRPPPRELGGGEPIGCCKPDPGVLGRPLHHLRARQGQPRVQRARGQSGELREPAQCPPQSPGGLWRRPQAQG